MKSIHWERFDQVNHLYVLEFRSLNRYILFKLPMYTTQSIKITIDPSYDRELQRQMVSFQTKNPKLGKFWRA
jgi:hypothetical protein